MNNNIILYHTLENGVPTPKIMAFHDIEEIYARNNMEYAVTVTIMHNEQEGSECTRSLGISGDYIRYRGKEYLPEEFDRLVKVVYNTRIEDALEAL